MPVISSYLCSCHVGFVMFRRKEAYDFVKSVLLWSRFYYVLKGIGQRFCRVPTLMVWFLSRPEG